MGGARAMTSGRFELGHEARIRVEKRRPSRRSDGCRWNRRSGEPFYFDFFFLNRSVSPIVF